MALTPEQQALDFDPELQGLSRERKLAELLMAKGAQGQPQGQMISGYYVAPSWSQQLNPMANALAGEAVSNRADVKETQLAQALRQQKGEALQTFQQLMSKPETRGQAMQYAASNRFLQPVVSEMMKPQKLGEGENLVMPSFGGGEPISLAGGGAKVAPEVRQAMQTLGINKPLDQLNPQELNAVRNEIYQVKRAGAPSTTVTMGKSIAGEIGPMMKDAQAVAQAAVKTEDSANRIIEAVNSNKLYTGTGANIRLGAAQVANTLGVGGNSLEEKISNTRKTMQGLAELTLQGRQQMRGQGQITNQESELAERAISGNINFTPAEIKLLANAAKRSADYTYNTYQAKVGEMARNTDTAGLVPYYQVPRMGQQTAQTINAQDQEALNWANANPNDPRAAKIKQRLGQ